MLTGKEHVARYEETDGRQGHYWGGTVTLLLTTTGRRSGAARTTPVIYSRDGERHVIVASNAGRDRPPDWYLNLQAQPEVTLQVGAQKFWARARVATEDERPSLWSRMVAAWPDLEEYQTRTPRRVPVIVLERL
jgi:deazaflavin-dependent oxidoreductase (nitroreductase family)